MGEEEWVQDIHFTSHSYASQGEANPIDAGEKVSRYLQPWEEYQGGLCRKMKLITLCAVFMLLCAGIALADYGEVLYYPMDEGSGSVLHDAWNWDGDYDNATIYNATSTIWNNTDTAQFGNGSYQPYSISVGKDSEVFTVIKREDELPKMFGYSDFGDVPFAYSISSWFKTNLTLRHNITFVWYDDVNGVSFFGETALPEYNFRISIQGADGGVNDLINLTGDTWYHIVLVHNGTYGFIYINGALNASDYIGLNSVGALAYGTRYGGVYSYDSLPDSSKTRFLFTGKIGQLKIYNYSLTASDVIGLYMNDTLLPFVDIPQYSSVSSDKLLYDTGNVAIFVSYWTSHRGIDDYIFSWNKTGVWVNDTPTHFGQVSGLIFSLKTITSDMEGKTFGWRIFANGTGFNATPIMLFNVSETGESFGYTPLYTAGDLSLITGDVVGTGMVNIKTWMPTMVLFWILLLLVILYIAVKKKMS